MGAGYLGAFTGPLTAGPAGANLPQLVKAQPPHDLGPAGRDQRPQLARFLHQLVKKNLKKIIKNVEKIKKKDPWKIEAKTGKI